MGLVSCSPPLVPWVLQAASRESGHILVPFQGLAFLESKVGRRKQKSKTFHNEDRISPELNSKIQSLLWILKALCYSALARPAQPLGVEEIVVFNPQLRRALF